MLEERFHNSGSLWHWNLQSAPRLRGQLLALVAVPRARLKPPANEYMTIVLDEAATPGDIDAIRAVARDQGRFSEYADLPDLDDHRNRYDVVVVVASLQ
jgi:hypothetical protein